MCFLLSIPDSVVQIIQTIDTALALMKPFQLLLTAGLDLFSRLFQVSAAIAIP